LDTRITAVPIGPTPTIRTATPTIGTAPAVGGAVTPGSATVPIGTVAVVVIIVVAAEEIIHHAEKADAGWVKMAAPAVITAAASLRGSFIGKSLLVSILV